MLLFLPYACMTVCAEPAMLFNCCLCDLVGMGRYVQCSLPGSLCGKIGYVQLSCVLCCILGKWGIWGVSVRLVAIGVLFVLF